jgi:hypothetical protein
MPDEPANPKRDRWLRVVRDGEDDPPPRPASPPPPAARPPDPPAGPVPAARAPSSFSQPAVPAQAAGPAGWAESAPRPAAPEVRRPSGPAGWAATDARSDVGRSSGAAGSATAAWSDVGRPSGTAGSATAARPTPPAPYGMTAARRGRPRWGVGWVWGAVAVGTGSAAGLDRVLGGLDGKPALFLLVILALPFWDALPARLPARLATLAGLVAAVAALWLAIAEARPQGWWRGEVAFGLACAIVGTVHALATARRTVDR